jgi:ferredoxin
LGGGSCILACKFGAITLVDGIAKVDSEKCTACGKCVEACPKNLAVMIPYKSEVTVACNSRETGKAVRANCQVGCIGCKLCVKACEHDAIGVEGALAEVDYDKCVNCGACAAKCPAKAIGVR